jgi:hypothetical protein
MMHSWVYRSILLGLMLLVVIVIAPHAMVTNDGPVHLSFANLLATMHQPNHPLQERAYTISLRPNPNLAVYFLLDALIRATSPGIAEAILQILSIIGPVAACSFALLMINPRNVWLAVFLLPLSINQMLFMGLYNNCVSNAAFFLTIGCYYWMIKAPSVPRAAVLSGCLVLTFLCHASGFIMAFSGTGAMSATFFVLSVRREEGAMVALKQQRYSLAAMMGPLPVVFLFLSTASKGNAAYYGVSVLSRLKQFCTLSELAVNLKRDVYLAGILSAILLVAFAVEVARIFMNRRGMPPLLRDEAIATVAAAVVSGVIMMAFPDTMGGGWTHFRRFEVFPFFWGLLVLAFDSFSIPVVAGLTAVGVSAGIALLSSMANRQMLIRDQMSPLAEVDRLVGNHCSVLPIVLQLRPLDTAGKPVWLTYEPYFQAASRLELTGDRVVLFNFLARLDAYPVHFRPNIEPQSNIFHWKPRQEETSIKMIDVDGFEKASGMQVDYILLWGDPAEIPEAQSRQVSNAVTPFSVVYKSPTEPVSLYYNHQRSTNSLCVVPNTEHGPGLTGQ